MKEEINELVKESLSENDYLEEQEEEQEVEIDFEDEGEEVIAPELELDLELDVEDETEDEMSDELPPLDLTRSSDDEVLKIFKAMGDEDGIIIQKDDEEIDKRHSRSRAQIKLTHRHLHQIDREKGRAITRPSSCHHKRLGVDHERIHEAQQNSDQQYALYLGQLYKAKYRPTCGAIDTRCLVVNFGDRYEPWIAEQHDQWGPVPDIHEY